MPLRRHHAAAMVLRSCYARSSSSFTSYCHAREEERDRAERDVRRKKGFTLPTVPPSPREGRRRCARHRRPRRAVVEPTKQKSIAAIHATIAVREASMAVAIEFTSERRKLQVRVKGVTPPFLTAQPSPHLVVARVATAACHCGFSPLRRSLAYVAAFRARFTGNPVSAFLNPVPLLFCSTVLIIVGVSAALITQINNTAATGLPFLLGYALIYRSNC